MKVVCAGETARSQARLNVGLFRHSCLQNRRFDFKPLSKSRKPFLVLSLCESMPFGNVQQLGADVVDGPRGFLLGLFPALLWVLPLDQEGFHHTDFLRK